MVTSDKNKNVSDDGGGSESPPHSDDDQSISHEDDDKRGEFKKHKGNLYPRILSEGSHYVTSPNFVYIITIKILHV